MRAYRFLFDQQTGQYKGLVRAPFPENCTDIEPHFSFGFKTCWDFHGEWKLVAEEKFFEQVLVQDVLKDYDREIESRFEDSWQYFYDLHRSIGEFRTENLMEHRSTNQKILDRIDEIEKTVLDSQNCDLRFLVEKMNNLSYQMERLELRNQFIIHRITWPERFIKSMKQFWRTIKASL